MARSQTTLVASLFVIAACGCNTGAPQASRSPEPSTGALGEAELIRQGEILVRLGSCGDCHTPMKFDPKLGMPVPDATRLLSGHPEGAPDPAVNPGQGDQAVIGATFTSFRLPFGVVYSANLTPDPNTGLGRWTEAEFIATMRTGHEKGVGRPVLPPMPWQNLSQQPEQNLKAVFAYLHSIPALKNRVPAPSVAPEVVASIDKSYAAAKQAVQ